MIVRSNAACIEFLDDQTASSSVNFEVTAPLLQIEGDLSFCSDELNVFIAEVPTNSSEYLFVDGTYEWSLLSDDLGSIEVGTSTNTNITSTSEDWWKFYENCARNQKY